MGRNKKQGLDYFPFDIDFFQDLKIRKLIKQQGGKAVTVYALLLCSIYKCGYYLRWDEELPFIISELTGFDEVYIQEVIKSCLLVGLLNRRLFDSDKILTSKGIQERYQEVCRISKRKCGIQKYSLIISSEEMPISSEEMPISSEEMPISSEEMPISSEESAQSKVKKIKVKKIKEKSVGETRTREELFSEEVFFAELSKPEKSEQIAQLAKANELSVDVLLGMISSIQSEWKFSGIKHHDYSDAARHLSSLIRIRAARLSAEERGAKVKPATGHIGRPPENSTADREEEKLRQRYSCRIPRAWEEGAPVNFLQYRLLKFDTLSDEELKAIVTAVEAGMIELPTGVQDMLNYKLNARCQT